MRRSADPRVLVFLSAVAVWSCRGQTSDQPPIWPIRNMFSQPRYNPQAESRYFSDHRTMRPPVEGTIPRESLLDSERNEGVLEDRSGYVSIIPASIVEGRGGMSALVQRGQDRFNIYCAVCHDRAGTSDSIVVRRGMLKPPVLRDERLRHVPDGQLFATITNGIRNMPAYRHQIPVEDRWAIVAYVRALQLSQTPPSVAAVQNPSVSAALVSRAGTATGADRRIGD